MKYTITLSLILWRRKKFIKCNLTHTASYSKGRNVNSDFDFLLYPLPNI